MFFVFTGNWTIGRKKDIGPICQLLRAPPALDWSSAHCIKRRRGQYRKTLYSSSANKQLNGNLFWRQIAPMPSCSILLAMSTLNDMETHSVEMPIDSDDVICGIEREKVAATLNLYLADFRMNMRREESDEAKTVLNSIQCPVFFF